MALAWVLVTVVFILQRNPELWGRPGPTFEEARALAAEGEGAAAIAIVDQLLSSDPTDVGNWTFKGYLELDLDRLPDAQDSFSAAALLRPDDAEAKIGLATSLQRQGAATESLTTLASLQPDRIEPQQLHRRSQLYALLDEYQASADDLDRLLEGRPDSTALLDEASNMAVALEDWTRAAELSARLETAAPPGELRRVAFDRREFALRQARDRDARLAYEADLSGDAARAEDLYRDLLLEQPGVRQHRVRLGWLLNESGRHQEAWAVVEGLPANATAPEILDLKARTAYWAGADDAVDLLEALIGIHPEDAGLWLMLSDTHRRLDDGASSMDALRSYVALEADDLDAKRDLADALAGSGSVTEAIAHYEALIAVRPDARSLTRLGRLYETSGELERAKPAYLYAVENSASPEPELFLRLGRLFRWTQQPAEAAPWFERYLAATTAATASDARTEAHSGLALALLESDRPDESLAAATKALAEKPDAALYEVAARAATTTGQASLAASFLEQLDALRPLSHAERVWLAGEYRSAGDPGRALELYITLVTADGASREVLEAVGDLRMDAEEYEAALEAYRRVAAVSDDAALQLKIARASAASGAIAEAADAYDIYLEVHPEDIDAQLEAARFLAVSRQPERAIDRYEVVLAARGADGHRLELARNYNAAERFDEAAVWAREAVAAGEPEKESRFVLAQSLHLQGRHDEASELLLALREEHPDDPEMPYWLGLVSIASDRNLQGFRRFDEAIELSAPEPQQAWRFRGDAALNRHDYFRAAQSYQQAVAHGLGLAEARAAQDKLRRWTLPAVLVSPSYSSDSNDLSLFQAGASGQLWPWRRGELRLRWLQGSVEQADVSYDRTVADLSVTGFFVTPELELGGALGLEDYSGTGGGLTTGRVSGRFHFAGTSAVGFEVDRSSLLSMNDRRELRQYNRILDLEALGPDFGITRVRGFADWSTVNNQRFLVDVGTDDYEDDNRRWFSYAHYQLPISRRARRWAVIRPSLYFEGFRDRSPHYFSPESHMSLGLALHTVRTHPDWSLEAEVNPQLVRTDGDDGLAASGLIEASRKFGRVTLGGGGFLFYDRRRRYVKWNISGAITIELGR